MRHDHRLTRGHRRPPRGVHRRLPDGSNPHPRRRHVVVRANPVETSLRSPSPRSLASAVRSSRRHPPGVPRRVPVAGRRRRRRRRPDHPRLLRFHDGETSGVCVAPRRRRGRVFLRANAAPRLAGFAALRRVGARVDGGGVVIEHNPSLVDVNRAVAAARATTRRRHSARRLLFSTQSSRVLRRRRLRVPRIHRRRVPIHRHRHSIDSHPWKPNVRADQSQFAPSSILSAADWCASRRARLSSARRRRSRRNGLCRRRRRGPLTLARLDRGTLNALVAVEGSLVVSSHESSRSIEPVQPRARGRVVDLGGKPRHVVVGRITKRALDRARWTRNVSREISDGADASRNSSACDTRVTTETFVTSSEKRSMKVFLSPS